MGMVAMKCPNCGGVMEERNGEFVCKYCGMVALNIVEVKIADDATLMSVEEFAKTIDESRNLFFVRTAAGVEASSVEAKVVNKKIADATAALEMGEYEGVERTLCDLDCFAAYRLRLLAVHGVKNEKELAFKEGLINEIYYDDTYNKDIARGLNRRCAGLYARVLELADEQTKAAYLKIAAFKKDRENVRKEILEVDRLLEVELVNDALAYATQTTRKYPSESLAWDKLCYIKKKINPSDTCDTEYEKMKKCPDYADYVKTGYRDKPCFIVGQIDEIKKTAELSNAVWELKTGKRFLSYLLLIVAAAIALCFAYIAKRTEAFFAASPAVLLIPLIALSFKVGEYDVAEDDSTKRIYEDVCGEGYEEDMPKENGKVVPFSEKAFYERLEIIPASEGEALRLEHVRIKKKSLIKNLALAAGAVVVIVVFCIAYFGL